MRVRDVHARMGAIRRQYCSFPADGTRGTGATLDHNSGNSFQEDHEIT
jgi:hypothetical protein